MGGRLDTLLPHTDAQNKKRVRDFFGKLKTLSPIVGECLRQECDPALPPSGSCPQQQLILLSRYRANLYICILNASNEELSLLQNIIEVLLHSTYGIKLKQQPHGDLVIWGQGALQVTDTGVSLTRKAMPPSLQGMRDAPGWSTCADASSPCARIGWRSHFPSLLRKCLWYGSTWDQVRCNLTSVLWGVGAKGYPKNWWRGQLTKFFRATQLDRIVPLMGLLLWVTEGQKYASGPAADAVGGG